MSDNLDLKKGLDIPVEGAAARRVIKKVVPGTVAVSPAGFKGFSPRLLVKEGDRVLAGSPVLADKMNSSILVTSPVSGTVSEVVRGEKRKLLAVLIAADTEQEFVDFGTIKPANGEDVKALLLGSGLWRTIVQRPYGVMADLSVTPKCIFVSSFSTAPLAADTEFAFGGEAENIQAGLKALSLLTEGGVHLGVNKEVAAKSPFAKMEGVITHFVSGPHPAGNVGVQISHICPILKGETVWTVSLLGVALIGRLLRTGKLDLTRKVAVTGPGVVDESLGYVEALPGTPVKDITAVFDGQRIISGDILSGESVGTEGYLRWNDNQLTILWEGPEREILGWAKPFRPGVFSSSMCYFSWLTPRKKYNMDTNLHGGPRAFVQTKCFEDVTPMDIFPIYLVKACLAGDIEKMEKFGIYEVLPEDLALCDYVDPSKNEIQAIISSGIDLMIKEMA